MKADRVTLRELLDWMNENTRMIKNVASNPALGELIGDSVERERRLLRSLCEARARLEALGDPEGAP